MNLLCLAMLAMTAEAYTPATPNGTTTQPGGPGSVVKRLDGPTCFGTGWEEVTRVGFGLILLLVPLVARLATRIQQLEDALARKPAPANPTPATTPVSG